MNKIFVFIVVVILSFVFIYAFSSSYSSHTIDNIAYVIAIGIDDANIDDNLKVTFEFINISSFSKKGASEESSPILEQVTAPSINSAVDIMNAYMGKQINLSHCKVIVFSESLARKGILNEISELINDKQVRGTTDIVITDSDSKEYLKNSISSLEKTVTKYYNIFGKSSSYTGYTSNISLGNFYEAMIADEAGSVAIHGKILPSSQNSKSSESNNSSQNSNDNDSKGATSNDTNSNTSSSESNTLNSNDSTQNNSDSNSNNTSLLEDSIVGDKGVENSGLAVFKENKLIDYLNSEEALCYSMISNKIDNFYITIDNPFGDSGLIDLSFSMNHNSRIKIDTSTDTPIINVSFSLDNKILNILENVDYNDPENLKAISEASSKYLEDIISTYLYRCSKELDCDINGFYKSAKSNFLNNNSWKTYNWKDKFKNSVFNVHVESTIIPNLIVSENK